MCDNKWRFDLRVSRFFPSFREACEFFFFGSVKKAAQERKEGRRESF